jgi:hypothetical protein
MSPPSSCTLLAPTDETPVASWLPLLVCDPSEKEKQSTSSGGVRCDASTGMELEIRRRSGQLAEPGEGNPREPERYERVHE